MLQESGRENPASTTNNEDNMSTYETLEIASTGHSWPESGRFREDRIIRNTLKLTRSEAAKWAKRIQLEAGDSFVAYRLYYDGVRSERVSVEIA